MTTGKKGARATRFTGRGRKMRVRTAKRRTASSTRWLERQLNDPYVAERARRGFRSRAAFKLAELDGRFRLLRAGDKVVDLGAAPGGWTQVAAERAGPKGRVVAVDILPMGGVAGAEIVAADFLDAATPAKIRAALGGPADVVLSDMSPPASRSESAETYVVAQGFRGG